MTQRSHDDHERRSSTQQIPPNDGSLQMTIPDEEQHVYQQNQPDVASGDELDFQLVDWEPNDPENPFNWKKSKKLSVTVLSLLGTFLFLINGTAITVAAADINDAFGISDASFPNSYWPVTSWTLGGAVFSLVILPLMEDIGVRTGYLVTYFVFILFVIPQAVATNFATEIVTRFFAGGCVTTLANITIGIICDVWAGEEARANPIALMITFYLAAASFGPVFGGAILQFLPWRWISYIQLIIHVVLFPVYFVMLKETRGSNILRQRAKKIRAETGKKAYTIEEKSGASHWVIFKTAIQRPSYMFVTEFVVFSMTMWSAFSVGLLYLFTQSTAQVFSGVYGWPAYSTGYIQGAVVVGVICGYFVWLVIQKRLYFDSAKHNSEKPGTPIPEARLYTAIPGSFIGMAGGMFLYAWTSYPSIPWIAPAIGLALVGCGANLAVIALGEYITDAYSMYAGSAVGVVAAGENIFSAFLPLAAQSMYTRLGFNWASSVLGFLALLISVAPVVILIWGKTIRARSPFIKKAQYEIDKKEDSTVS